MNNEFLTRYSSAILACKIQCINVFKLRKEASEIMKDHNMKPEHLRTLDNAFKVLMEFPNLSIWNVVNYRHPSRMLW